MSRVESLTTTQIRQEIAALLDSPALTGTPTAPTQATSDNSTKLATTAYVVAKLASGTSVNNRFWITIGAPGAGLGIDNDIALDKNSGVFYNKVTGIGWATETTFLSDLNTNALKKQLADAKGDLFVGSANDTVVRLPVGANGTVPIADSTQTTGIRWGSAGGGSGPSNQAYLWRETGIVSGRVRIGAVTKDGSERWHFPDVGKIYFLPGYYESTFGVNGFGVSLRGSDAAATVHVGLYTDNAGVPGNVVASSSVSGATSGWKNMDITAVTGLASGWYWHAVLAVGAGLDIHGGWMIHPMDATNMENGIRHNAWAGFRTVSAGFTSLTNNPSVERIQGILPWAAVRFN